MPPRNVRRARSGSALRGLLLLPALACGVSPAHAQDLPLKRDYPGSGPYVCAPVEVPEEEAGVDAKAQARQLASAADQAVILGDLSRARALLVRATELDPRSPELAYRHARALEDLGEAEDAVQEYCRALAVAPEGAGASDARDRLESLAAAERARVPETASAAFRTGVARADQGLLGRAAESFTQAVTEAPDWAEAYYNRGAMLAELGRSQAAAADLQRYLDLLPDAPDAIRVSQRIGQLQAAAVRLPSPGAALTLGIVLPGMGHFYTGRPVGGAVVLSLAGGAVAAGLLIKNVIVRCLFPVPAGQDCPPDQVVSEEIERPHLVKAIAAGAAVALIGAIEAAIRAGGRRARAMAGGASEAGGGDSAARLEVRRDPGDGVRVLPPAVLLDGPAAHRGGAVDVRLLGIAF